MGCELPKRALSWWLWKREALSLEEAQAEEAACRDFAQGESES